MTDGLERIRHLLLDPGPAVVGDRLRRLRQGQKLSIRDLAEAADLNKTTVVRLEAGENVRPRTVLAVCRALTLHVERLASLSAEAAEGSLARVAVHRGPDDRWVDMADVGGDLLFDPDEPVTRQDRERVAGEGVSVPMCILRSRLSGGRILPTVLEIYGESVESSHRGEEFVYVLDGRVRLTIDDETFVLGQGESLTFFSAEPHRYAPADPPPGYARILSVRVEG